MIYTNLYLKHLPLYISKTHFKNIHHMFECTFGGMATPLCKMYKFVANNILKMGTMSIHNDLKNSNRSLESTFNSRQIVLECFVCTCMMDSWRCIIWSKISLSYYEDNYFPWRKAITLDDSQLNVEGIKEKYSLICCHQLKGGSF